MKYPASFRLEDIFPEKFTPEQIIEFRAQQGYVTSYALPTVSTGGFKVCEKFKNTFPYRIQVLTGQPWWQASNITFTGKMGIEKNPNTNEYELYGVYKFKSPAAYGGFTNTEFKAWSTEQKYKIYNLTDSVLGNQDFLHVVKEVPLIPDLSYLYIASFDEAFIRGSPVESLARFNKPLREKLLAIGHLSWGNIHLMDEQAREEKGKDLFAAYLNEKEYVQDAEGRLTMDQYVAFNSDMQSKIIDLIGLEHGDIPTISEVYADPFSGLREKLEDRKVFFMTQLRDNINR